MPKVNEAYLEARRRQVLDAALACFARKGFHETTMQDIAREAEVSYGVVYHYFRSKEDVIEASWQTSQQARAARFRIPRQKSNTPDALTALLTTYLRRLEQPESSPEMRLRILLFAEALLNPRIEGNIRRTWDDVLGNLEEIIRRGQEQEEINPELDPRVVARLYLAVLDGIALQKTIDSTVDLRQLIEAFWVVHRGDLWQDRRKGVSDDDERELRSTAE